MASRSEDIGERGLAYSASVRGASSMGAMGDGCCCVDHRRSGYGPLRWAKKRPVTSDGRSRVKQNVRKRKYSAAGQDNRRPSELRDLGEPDKGERFEQGHSEGQREPKVQGQQRRVEIHWKLFTERGLARNILPSASVGKDDWRGRQRAGEWSG